MPGAGRRGVLVGVTSGVSDWREKGWWGGGEGGEGGPGATLAGPPPERGSRAGTRTGRREVEVEVEVKATA